MAENGKNCDQRRMAMSKEQQNGNFTGKVWYFGGKQYIGLSDLFLVRMKLLTFY